MRSYLVLMLLMLPALLNAECFETSVEIQAGDQNGKVWDKNVGKWRKPDLVLCIHDSLGLRCILNASNPEHHKAFCEDSYECKFPSTPFPDPEFILEVKDMDVGDDERAGIAKCIRDETCLVGLATVRFTAAECPSYGESHNKKLQPIADAPAE